VIATLSNDFVNAWVLAKELEPMAQRAGDEDLAELCATLKENYSYPVDSVLVTPALEVVGQVSVNEPPAFLPELYAHFLARGLATARGEEPPPAPEEETGSASPPPVRLTPSEPEGTVLDLVVVASSGSHEMRFFALDASAFDGPVELSVEVRLGTADAAGTFELCAAYPDMPEMMSPVETLARLEPGKVGTLSHAFERGALFGLVVKGAEGETEGATNAFLATVRARAR
jgi:hypothetical protein